MQFGFLKSVKFYFLFIALSSLLVRFINLQKFPVSLNWDEISHGYNAYSLLKTGQDQWGKNWPIYNFRAYGDYPTTLNLYLTIPFISILGLNELSIRLPSAICGFLTVLMSYFLGKAIFKNKWYALLLMFTVAISPWTFFSSRGVFQSTVSQFFMISGFTLLFYITRRPWLLPISSLLLGLSLFAYHNTRIVTPVILVFFLFLYRKNFKKFYKLHQNISLFSLILFSCFFLPSSLNLLQPESQARSHWVSIINENSINYLNVQRNNFHGSQLIAKLIYNKPNYFIFYFIKNYLDFLNPLKLFFTGTENFQFNIPNNGILFPIWLPFFYIGLLSVIRSFLRKDLKSCFLFFWLLVGLLPAALTYGDFPIIRATSCLPVPQILIVIGVTSFLKILPQVSKSALLLFFLVTIFQFSTYLYQYFIVYPINYSSSWQYGYKEIVEYVKENYQKYDQIYITKKYGEPHEFLLFYWPWDPKRYLSDPNLKWDYHASWYWVNSFDKFVFSNDWEIISTTKDIKKTSLIITSPGNYPEHGSLLKTVYFLNQRPAFDIVALNEK